MCIVTRPGVEGSRIYSTLPKNRYGYMSGTSMACPQVTGLAALLMSMRRGIRSGH